MSEFNGLTPAQEERLVLLQEEANEVGQAVAKVLRHGYESTNPDQPNSASNRSHLQKELGQLHLASRLLCEAKDLQEDMITVGRQSKARTLPKWLHHQENKDLVAPANNFANVGAELANRVVDLNKELEARGQKLAEANGAKAELTARIKELEKQVTQLTSENRQLLADTARQAGYIDRVLEQEAPQDVQMAPSELRTSGVLIAKGPRVGGRHGSGIDHDHFLDRTRY